MPKTEGFIVIPPLDKNGTPKRKLPDCPQCGQDELYVLPVLDNAPVVVRCYTCDFHQMNYQRMRS